MKIRQDNKGFSLVEMLVAVAILSIVMAGIAGILSSMMKSFGQSQREVQLQDSVQATYSVVSDIIKSSQCVKNDKHNYCVENDGGRVYIYDETLDQSHSGTGAKGTTDEGTCYIIKLNSSSHKLYLYSQEYDPTGDTSISDIKLGVSDLTIMDPGNLLANNVKSFAVNTDNVESGFVVVTLEAEYKDRTANISQNVYLRNSNAASAWKGEAEDPGEGGEGGDATPTDTPTPTPAPTVAPGASFTLSCIGQMEEPKLSDIGKQVRDVSVYYKSEGGAAGGAKVVCAGCNKQLSKGSIQVWDGSVGANVDKVAYDGCSNNECANKGYSAWNGYVEGPNDLNGKKSLDAAKSAGWVKVETGPVVEKTGTIIIRNESLDNTVNGVVINLQFQDDDAYFESFAPTEFLKADASLTTCGNACTYKYYNIVNGNKTRFIKIFIPCLNPAVRKADGTFIYNQIALKYKWADTSGNTAVACTYEVKSGQDAVTY